MLGQRLKALRIASRKTQRDIADVLNISRSAYALYEAGKRQLGYETLLSLAEYYNVSLDYLFERTEVKEQLGDFETEERRLLEQFRRLDARGRDTVQHLMELECRHTEKDKA